MGGERGRRKARHFTVRGGGVFAFAGLWDAWGAGKDRLLTACLVTAAANDLVRTVHDRMPAVVPPESYAEWLDPATPERRLLELLVPYPAEDMEVREVGPAVNSPRNGGPECLEAA